MNVTKTNPVGIDVEIQKFQTDIYNALIEKWGLTLSTNLYECYGRCYKNKKDNGYIAEHYTGQNDKYKEVFWDSKLAAISFFGISDKIENKSIQSTDVHLVFFVDLKKLKPSIHHRADEEVRADVLSIVANGSYGFSFDSIELYLENCLKEYNGSLRDERLKFVDMHPSHCFRLNFSLDYNIKNYCTPIKNF